jgi:hypothetical protein
LEDLAEEKQNESLKDKRRRRKKERRSNWGSFVHDDYLIEFGISLIRSTIFVALIDMLRI